MSIPSVLSDSNNANDEGIGLNYIGTELQFDGKVMGIKALKTINKGTFLARYVGELITNYNQVISRMKEPGQKYVVELDPNVSWICAKYMGNWTRMINHHCTKFNCILRRFREADNSFSLGIFSFKKIKIDDSLFFHYGVNNSEHINEPILCLCCGVDMNNNPICRHEL